MGVESGELALMMTGYGLEADQPANAEESARLLSQAKAGDASAFEQIIIRHERQVLMTALRLLGHLEDAQDAAQEVFLRLYKYLHHFDETREFSPWLYRMTVNVCRDMNRRRQKGAMLSLDEMRQSGELEEMTSPLDLEAAITLTEEKRIVAEGLKTLSEKERAALVLRDIEGLSTKEVARILGSSEATVRSQVSTARVKIKKFTDRFLRRQR
jgi:RNA polymerase sigma-70 factor (ECF subfamily)